MKRKLDETELETLLDSLSLSPVSKKARCKIVTIAPRYATYVSSSTIPTERLQLPNLRTFDDPFHIGNIQLTKQSYTHDEVVDIVNKRERMLYMLYTQLMSVKTQHETRSAWVK